MLQAAIEAEVSGYVAEHGHLADVARGHRLVVRNGYQPGRTIQSGLGDIRVRKPRVHDRRPGEKFTSRILPPYMRRTPSIEALIPVLYLKGDLDERLPRRPGGHPGAGRGRSIRDDDHSAEAGLGGRIPGVVAA